MVRNVVLAAGALSLSDVSGSTAQQPTWQIDPAHSAAQFSVRHMMVSTVRGTFEKMSGTVLWDGKDITTASVEATIETASITTREPKRDAHLKSADFFDAAKFPRLTFKSVKIEPAGPGKAKMTGDLTIRGATKRAVFDVEGPTPPIKDPYGNARVGATATTKINRQDFGVSWNGVLDAGGVVVGDEVTITVDIEIVRKAA
jgi:polyisoprenoid-binding protein YceI